MSALREQIANLTAAEKADLLDEVWESLEADAGALSDAQRAELDARIERLEKNPSDVIPRAQVKSDLLKQK
ncbi:MAG: addiction module protein [Candidatus Korobacteraceae bacterium]